MNLEINQIINAMTMTTMMTPDQTPALNIPPITSQLESKVTVNAISDIKLILFIIDICFY